MSRLTPLWDTPELQVRRFDHAHAGHAHDDAEEVAGQYIISVVERGRFLLHCRGQSWELGPGDVMLSRPGMEFRVHQVDLSGDSDRDFDRSQPDHSRLGR